MGKIPKDHYVPQMFLNGFAINPSDANPHIYQYMEDKIVDPAIKDVASEKHFYTFKSVVTGEPNREIDDLLTMIEDKASAPLKKIIESGSIKLSDEECECLSIFFAVLAMRTPAAIKFQESFEEEAIKEMMSIKAIDKESFRKDHEEAGIFLTEHELERQRKFVTEKEYSVAYKDARAHFLSRGLENALSIADWYYTRKHWHLLINLNSEVFVTSDNPIVIFRPVYVPPVYSAGYGSGTIIIPISPKFAILLRDIPLKEKHMTVSSKHVGKINESMMQFSDKYIFSNLKSKKIDATYKKMGNKRYQKAKAVRIKNTPYTVFSTNSVSEELFH